MRFLFIVAAVLLTQSTAVAAREATDGALEPDSKWALQPAESHCSLTRRFGKDRPVHFQIRQFPGDDLLEFSVLGRDVNLSIQGEGAIANWEPDVSLFSVDDPYKMRSEVGPGVLFRANLIERGDEAEDGTNPYRDGLWAQAEIFSLEGVVRTPIRLRTGSMRSAMRALEKCVDRLVASWNVAPARIGPRVKDLEQWGRKLTRNYPPAAAMAGTQGSVRTILVVDESGRIERCFAQLPVLNTELQDHACDALKEHARFEPAVDAGGNTVKSLSTFVITYQLR